MCITSKNIVAYNTNNTKGSLCATAYRTVGTDSLCYKYYRYDARGRVIKMWNYIAGLGMKTFDYSYNSQNQITELIYQSGYSDTKSFKYAYDYAGRLLNTSFNYIPSDSPEEYITFNSYTYNQNSQINTSKFDPINLTHTNSYDSRNRITNNSCSKPDLFSYNLTYYSNSNIQTQSFTGQYKNSFSNQDNLSTSFTYDKSNRLLNANFTHTSDNTFDLTNTFDPDGNILTMQRYGSNNNLTDNFTYDYYTGTNRLKKVSGSNDQYTYDYNGNQTNDYLNNNTSIKYDHRNLITEFTRQDLAQDPPITNVTRYKYDESGNRIRKTIYRSTESNPPPLPEETEDLPTGWSIILDDYYLREVSGKEIAIYSSYTLQYWNVWSGIEIVGRINNTENVDRNYYLKDHLGSIRVVLDNSKNIVSANDFDMWGWYLENRTYSTSNTKNKFTGKERDNESSYDYFGARYYDARIGNWLTTDPLFQKRIAYSPYNYVTRNPLILIDLQGLLDDYFIFDENGRYKTTVYNDEPDQIVIENSQTKERNYYGFNDPKKDAPWLKELVKKYGSSKQFIYIKTIEDINNYMDLSGVTNIFAQEFRVAFASLNSLPGWSMDYWQSYLTGEMIKNDIIDEDIKHDQGGFYLFPSRYVSYNAMDAGNYLWGRGMRELGFDYSSAEFGSQMYNKLKYGGWDSPFDQEAIRAGFHSK